MTTITTTKLFAVMPLALGDESADDLLIDRELTQAPLGTEVFNYRLDNGTPVRLIIDHYYLLDETPNDECKPYIPPECRVYTLKVGDEHVAVQRVQKVKLHLGARRPGKYVFSTDAGEFILENVSGSLEPDFRLRLCETCSES